MRLLLTGASGFIGARVVTQLAGLDAHALGRSPVPGIGFIPCDLLKEDPVGLLKALQPTHLLHLAWNEDRRTIWNGVENLAWVAATLRLLLAFRAAGGQRAVFAGSCAEYDWSHSYLDEAATPLRPHTGYGLAKRALFDLVSGTVSLSPVSVGWARIFFPFGPNDKPDRLLSQVIDGVAAGRPVECSQGLQVRPFIHVDDVASALIALLRSDMGEPVNIALEEPVSVRDLALTAARHAGDATLLRFGSRPLQPGEPPVLKASVNRLTRELGFAPRYSIEDGVKAAVGQRLGRVSSPTSLVSNEKGINHG